MKSLYIVTGPIGAGKSTLKPIIMEHFSITQVEYVSADYYFENMFGYLKEDFYERNRLAKEEMLKKLKECIQVERSVLWETVIAKNDKIEMINAFIKAEFKIVVFFVGVNEVDECIKRVYIRQSKRGFIIPEEKIQKKYYDAFRYLELLKNMADEVWIINNSGAVNEISFERNK